LPRHWLAVGRTCFADRSGPLASGPKPAA
jgi:hypothetical protein